jgi:hypothetical protein
MMTQGMNFKDAAKLLAIGMVEKRAVTEFDLRAPEFRHPETKVEDLEFDGSGKVVRKDRFERAFRSLVEPAGFSLRGYEIDEVAQRIQNLLSIHEVVLAIVHNEAVVFRRTPQQDDESSYRNKWTLWVQGKHEASPYNFELYEFETLFNAEEAGYLIDRS